MSDGVTFSVSGHTDVRKMLGELPNNIRKRVLQKAASMAMKPALATARRNAPRKTGALRRSLKSKVVARNRRGVVGQVVSTSKGWFKGDEFYGAFQEFGWTPGARKQATGDLAWKKMSVRARRKYNRSSGKPVLGKHFIEQAYDTHKEQAAKLFIDLCRQFATTGLPQDKRGKHLKSGGK